MSQNRPVSVHAACGTSADLAALVDTLKTAIRGGRAESAVQHDPTSRFVRRLDVTLWSDDDRILASLNVPCIHGWPLDDELPAHGPLDELDALRALDRICSSISDEGKPDERGLAADLLAGLVTGGIESLQPPVVMEVGWNDDSGLPRCTLLGPTQTDDWIPEGMSRDTLIRIAMRNPIALDAASPDGRSWTADATIDLQEGSIIELDPQDDPVDLMRRIAEIRI